VFASFLEDIQPKYILMVAYNPSLNTSSIYLIKMVKNNHHEVGRPTQNTITKSATSKGKVLEEDSRADKLHLSRKIIKNPSDFKLGKCTYEENLLLVLDDQKTQLLRDHTEQSDSEDFFFQEEEVKSQHHSYRGSSFNTS